MYDRERQADAAHESMHLDLLGIARQLHIDAPDLGAICDGLAEAVAHRYSLYTATIDAADEAAWIRAVNKVVDEFPTIRPNFDDGQPPLSEDWPIVGDHGAVNP
jgi:hypothetical protein